MKAIYKSVKLLWQANIDEAEQRFIVEIAHLLGFKSTNMIFPILTENGGEQNTLYFVVGKDRGECLYDGKYRIEKKDNLIYIDPQSDPEGAYRWVNDNIEGLMGIKRFPRKKDVDDFVCASDHGYPLHPRYERKKTGLECLFMQGLGMEDTDCDGLPDKVELRLKMDGQADYSFISAACDMAARIGMETTCIRYPFVTEEGDANVIYFSGKGSNRIILNENGCIRVDGRNPAGFVSRLCTLVPFVEEEKSLLDCVEQLQESFAMGNLDGQLAKIEAIGEKAKGAKCFCSPRVEKNSEKIKNRWPDTLFEKHTKLCEVYSRSFDIPWEVDEAKKLLEAPLAGLNAGDRVELFGALSEDREVRDEFKEYVRQIVEANEGSLDEANVICAYKQGFSWLEEIITPALIGKDIDRIHVRFKPFLRPGTTDWGDESGVTPSYQTRSDNLNKWFDLPIRYLQELFPIDDIIAPQIGISRDDVEITAYDGDEDITYLVTAYGKDGNVLLEKNYKAAYNERPYLSQFPQMGLVHPSTGFVRLRINGKTVIDERVKTDLERLWDTYQDEVLGYLRRYTDELCGGEPQENMQPFFAQIRLDITVSEPERSLGIREDLISPLDALHEDIYFAGLDFYKVYGLNATGANLDAPGLFLPTITRKKGKPEFKMTHYAQLSDTPEIRLQEEMVRGSCTYAYISEIRDVFDGLMPVFNVDGEEKTAEALVRLAGEGMTEVGRLLSNYGYIAVRCGETEFVAKLPRESETLKDLSIGDVTIPEDQLIGYEQYNDIINKLKRIAGISVFKAGESYQGRDIMGIRLLPDLDGYISRTKLMTRNPTLLINGRHHANEVSATNAMLMVLRVLLTERKYQGIANDINIIMIPMENVDGVAIHYDLQQKNPTWKLHIARYNSLGKEFYRDYYDVKTIHREALCMRDMYYRWLPDVFVDNHGVPSHEWEQQFSGYTSPWFKGFWLPRALLYGYYWYVTDPEYSFNERLNRSWADSIAIRLLEDNEIQKWNEDWRDRHEKYAHRWMPKLFPADYYKNMINYWVPSQYDPKHGYMAVRFPWITALSFTSEVADETAQGKYLSLCARTQAEHMYAGIDLIKEAVCVYMDSIERKEDGLELRAIRKRPMISPEDIKKKENPRKSIKRRSSCD